jgi:hypothetical protein
VFDAASDSAPAELPPAWRRLEGAADEAVAALEAWRKRALEAEAEAARLRIALEEAVAEMVPSADPRDQLRRLRAENKILHSRIAQAHRRVSALLDWTHALEKGG